MLQGLIYVSDKSYDLADEEFSELVSKASIKNKSNDITGFVCELEDNYLQYLEGEPQKIEYIMNAIRSDERHFNIKEFTFDIGSRNCSEWAMISIPTAMVGSVHFGHLVQTVLNLINRPGFEILKLQNLVKNLIQKWIESNNRRNSSIIN